MYVYSTVGENLFQCWLFVVLFQYAGCYLYTKVTGGCPSYYVYSGYRTYFIVLLCLCVILFVLYTLASGVHKASVHSASLHAYKLKTTTDSHHEYSSFHALE